MQGRMIHNLFFSWARVFLNLAFPIRQDLDGIGFRAGRFSGLSSGNSIGQVTPSLGRMSTRGETVRVFLKFISEIQRFTRNKFFDSKNVVIKTSE